MRTLGWILLALPALAQPPIVSHPKELKYAPLPFTAPKAADFRHRLASGATVFLVEDHELPVLNIQILVRTGEYLEPAGKAGLAQLTGSQIRAGGTTTIPPAEFDEQAAFLAANLTSAIGEDQGTASLNCLSKDLDAGLALLTTMLRQPAFSEVRLSLAKNQTLQALTRRNDNTAGIEAREWGRLLRGTGHYSTRQPTKADIDGITRQDMVEFHRKYYRPSNFVIAVSGDFKSAAMLAALDKAFAGWPDDHAAVPLPPKPAFTPKPGVYLVNKDVNQGRVRMGHLGDMISNPDQYAIDVMNLILGGGGFTSRITARVRSDEGLAYQAGSTFTHGMHYPGSFAAIFQSKNETVAQAVAIVREEMERIRSASVTKEEVAAQVNFLVESFPRKFATPTLRAGQFAADFYHGMPEDYWQKYRDRLRAVTPEDVLRVAKQYVQPDKLVVLVVGNAEAVKKGNPDKPNYRLPAAEMIPLPDPLTMIYPK
jgi:zinc protease